MSDSTAAGLRRLPWPAIAPFAAWLVFLLTFWLEGPVATTLVAAALVGVVFALFMVYVPTIIDSIMTATV